MAKAALNGCFLSQDVKIDSLLNCFRVHRKTGFEFLNFESLAIFFFPKFSNKPIRCILVDDENLLLYNGIAFVSDEERKLIVLKRILESRLFWSYIQSNGKPYASEYFSLTGIDIKNFSVPEFNEAEEDDLIAMINKEEIEEFLDRYYR